MIFLSTVIFCIHTNGVINKTVYFDILKATLKQYSFNFSTELNYKHKEIFISYFNMNTCPYKFSCII